MKGEVRVSFRDVRKTFRTRNRSDSLRDAIAGSVRRLFGGAGTSHPPFVALDGVSLSVEAGESVGIVGANGAGKSTALRLAAGIYLPDGGTVDVRGRISALIELSAGFHPDLTGRENIYLVGALQGLRRWEITERLDAIAAFADIGDFIENPIRTYSSGMAVRLGFAVAAHVPAEVLLVDEVLAVGDLDFQVKCLKRLSEMREQGVSVLFVSHNLQVVERFCDRVFFLHHGRVAASGPPGPTITAYREAVAKEKGIRGTGWTGIPAERMGTGEVVLEDIRLSGDPGLAEGCARSGGGVQVSGSWRAVRPIRGAVFGVVIHSPTGEILAEACSATGATSSSIFEGNGHFLVSMPKVSLCPGDYHVSVYARDGNKMLPYDVHSRLYLLRLLGDAPPWLRGILNLEQEWSITAGDA